MMASGLMERAMAHEVLPVRSGVLVAVVGPSGAGKDTLLKAARDAFTPADDVLFVRRTITRPEDGETEAHRALSVEAFRRDEAAGAFAVVWEAHGLSYGIPCEVDDHVASGHVAVLNGSRAALPLLAARYQNLHVVHVTARPEIRAERLAARGREDRAAILARLAREAEIAPDRCLERAVTIDNSGAVEDGVAALVAEIRKAIAIAAVSDAI